MFEDKVYSKLRKKVDTDRVVIRKYKNFTEGRFFFLRSADKTCYIKNRLGYMQPYFLELLGLVNFEKTNYVSEKSFYTYGIIVSIGKNRITKDSVYLMNNIDESNSVLVKLNLQYLECYSLFPGQIVAVKGKNVAGNEIFIEDIECMPVLDINYSDKKCFEHIYRSKPLEIITASGPFSEDGISFAALETLLEENPDLFILHGPFFPPSERYGMLNPFEAFKSQVLDRIQGWVRGSTSRKAILVPSMDDITSMKLLPQVFDFFGHIDDRVVLFSNPSMFFVNEFLFATSSTDLLLPLIGEECFLNEKKTDTSSNASFLFGGDRIERICCHLVFQKSFLPTFPPLYPVSLSNPKAFDIDISPDFFIVSSKVRNFKKDIASTIIINHGSQGKVLNKVYSKTVIGLGEPRAVTTFHKFVTEKI